MCRWLLVVLAAAPGCLPPWDYGQGTTGDSTGGEASSSSGEDGGESSGSSTSTSGSAGGSGEGTSDGGSSSPEASSSDGSDTSSVEPYCGDGEVDPDQGEECDDGVDNGPEMPCSPNCARRRTVFVTSEEYSPKYIGGLALADGICRQQAQKGGHDRYWTYVAWLSDSTTSAAQRLYMGRGEYVRPDGVLVAKNGKQFLSGQLEAPIIVTEWGMMLEGAGVWTGTLPDGSAVPDAQHCEDWSSQSLQIRGHYGLATESDSWWTYIPDLEINPTPCGVARRMYCMEGE